MSLLGVNVDHVATIRQARETFEPDPVWAAAEAQLGGADIITVHLREDRRHICDRDVALLRQSVSVELNLEMSLNEEIIGIALETHPDMVTLVPERREEVTTEGGLDVRSQSERVRDAILRFKDADIGVSLFVDPEKAQIEASARLGAKFVELHTGSYANARGEQERGDLLDELSEAAQLARTHHLIVNAGHGLTYNNVSGVVAQFAPHELHIGHTIVSRALFVGLRTAVAQMKEVIHRAQMLSK